ncbi:hypothetical protein LCGC14_2487270 [marine sediment metagenome]|uniref:Uncharacterized protein n=1 Tax=marine sediment metagenome TaxID=412755 RepID=A0A0F9B6N7_9ZZZZ
MYIDLDYFVVTEAEINYNFGGFVDIEIKAHAHISKEIYDVWVKTKDNKNNTKLKEIGNGGH